MHLLPQEPGASNVQLPPLTLHSNKAILKHFYLLIERISNLNFDNFTYTNNKLSGKFNNYFTDTV